MEYQIKQVQKITFKYILLFSAVQWERIYPSDRDINLDGPV